jgi:hypothetical protein
MKINWPRFIVGSLIAAIIGFLSDGAIHESLLGGEWKAVYSNLGITEPPHSSSAMLYFGIFELGRGFVSMLLYVMMRSHFGPGPKTAALAGVAAWVAFSLTAPAQFIPLGFFSNSLWLKVGALQLLTSIVATIAGAALYKDASSPVASPAT